jgi:hypothetical protein
VYTGTPEASNAGRKLLVLFFSNDKRGARVPVFENNLNKESLSSRRAARKPNCGPAEFVDVRQRRRLRVLSLTSREEVVVM